VIDEFSNQLFYKYSVPNSRTIPENGTLNESSNTITWNITYLDPGEFIEIIYYAETIKRCSGWNKVSVTTYLENLDSTLYDEDLISIKVCDFNNPEIDLKKEVFNEDSIEWTTHLSCNRGCYLTFKLTVKNNALDQLTNIKIIDYIPEELRYISDSSNIIPNYLSDNLIIWNFSQMNPDDEIEIIYQVKSVGVDICSNNAIATAFINTFQFNDSDSVLIDIKDPPIVQIVYPTGGEEFNGNIRIQWFAIDSECNPIIWLYYSNDGGKTWIEIARDLINTIGDGNYNDRGEYNWNINSLSNGNYIIKIIAYDKRGNRATDTCNPFTIGTGGKGLIISYITIDGSNTYINNDDTIEIQAGISFGSHISKDYINADLSGLGRGDNVPADNFNGITATWIVSDIICTPSDGLITIKVTATDGASISSKTETITADNTIPDLEIIKPQNGIYIGNEKYFEANKPIIIGSITIEANSYDLSSINKTEIYIDNELIETQLNNINVYINKKLIGKHELKIKTYDNAGNNNEYCQNILFLNLNGDI
jgi:uncharacterized repeat protein (TIGR01451 family)